MRLPHVHLFSAMGEGLFWCMVSSSLGKKGKKHEKAFFQANSETRDVDAIVTRILVGSRFLNQTFFMQATTQKKKIHRAGFRAQSGNHPQIRLIIFACCGIQTHLLWGQAPGKRKAGYKHRKCVQNCPIPHLSQLLSVVHLAARHVN